jgi:hypothetical protein
MQRMSILHGSENPLCLHLLVLRHIQRSIIYEIYTQHTRYQTHYFTHVCFSNDEKNEKEMLQMSTCSNDGFFLILQDFGKNHHTLNVMSDLLGEIIT